MSRRPPRPKPRCAKCNRITEARDGICRDCKAGIDPVQLPEGKWVPNGRGIVVFRKADGLAMDRGDAA